MESFTPLSAFIGGTLIGVAAVLLFALNGQIAGVSGILGGLVTRRDEEVSWRVLFLAGLTGGALAFRVATGDAVPVTIQASVPALVVAGLSVGYGTRLGGGCTSGHGVCGIARLSVRSLVATGVFMATAMLTVFVARHVLGG
jgi:hypothetical protein